MSRRNKRRARASPAVAPHRLAAQNAAFGQLESQLQFLFGSTSSGKVVNERVALEMVPVLACVRLLSETIAGLPLHVFKRGEKGSRDRDYEHPLHLLMHDAPNDEMTSFEFRRCMMGNVLIWGNAYAQIVRNSFGDVLELIPLNADPSVMQPCRTEQGELIYKYHAAEGKPPFSAREILHIRDFSMDGMKGFSRVALAKDALGLLLAAQEYGATFFNNSATPSGVIKSTKTENNAERIKKSWSLGHSGKNSQRVALLEDGMDYEQIGIPPNQAQFLETRKFQIAEVSRVFNVPLHMISDLEKSSFSNIEQQALEFAKYSITPWIVCWEQAMNKALLSRAERKTHFFKFNMDALLRGDYESRMRGHRISLGSGIHSVNEVRRMEDRNPIPAEKGGDLHTINGAAIKLEDAGAAYGKGPEAQMNIADLRVLADQLELAGLLDGKGGDGA